MAGVKLGVNLWSQASDWPAFLAAGLRADAARLRPPLDLGPHLRHLRRPAPADLRGLHGARGPGPGDGADPGSACSSAPTPSATRASRRSRSRPSTTSAAAGRSWASAVPGSGPSIRPSASTSAPGSGSASTGWPRRLPRSVTLLDGGEVTSPPGGRYAFDHLRIDPAPVQAHLPIMVGGAARRRRCGSWPSYADIWNVFGTPETVARKDAILRAHCAEVGRDEAQIERTLGCKVTIRSHRGGGGARPTGDARAQQDADGARGGRRLLLDRARRSRSPTPSGAIGRSGSTPSSSSWRPRTTTRPWRRSSSGQADGRERLGLGLMAAAPTSLAGLRDEVCRANHGSHSGPGVAWPSATRAARIANAACS